MLSAHLEDRFRHALAERGRSRPDESVNFAVEFTRLLVRILPRQEISATTASELREAIAVRTELEPEEIGLLLDLALTPENRAAITEDDLRAFGSRFGKADEEALRASVAEEVDLEAFAHRYGTAEALLLLDSLFGVCAVDGVIDRQEIGRLVRAAEQLGIDPVLVGALFRKHDVRHASGDFSFELAGDRVVVGRATACQMVLPDPQVAERHAELIRADDGWRVRDLGSGRPTLLNGSPITSAPFTAGDQLRVGSYTLTIDKLGQKVTAFGLRSFSALSVRHLRRTIGGVSLLDDVSFTVFSGEVIAVVGPSGAGKTTLLTAIAGIAPPDSGDVLLDGQNFHTLLANDRSIIGIVPQEDVVHAELSVRESLTFSGRLRFPRDTDREALAGEVDRVLDELDIGHIQHSRVGDAVRRGISGGQRKRVNLGQELLTRSTKVLFLDEPTSGLDPQTAQDIVSLIRQLADGGRIVFLVTHDVTPSVMSMVDHLMVLAPGGRLAWFGPPAAACEWFAVQSPDEIFARLPDHSPPEWGSRYRDGAPSRKFVRTREHLLGLDGVDVSKPAERAVHPSRLGHYLTLTRRYAAVKVRDTAGMGVLLAQAPILGVAMWIVFAPAADSAAMFMLSLSALWFGASASVRELISERAIWRREARVGVGTLPYLASKVTVLGAIVALQCTVLALMNYFLLGMYADPYRFDPVLLVGFTSLTGLVGMALGLSLSAVFPTSEAAVGTLPLVLIPQITFGGLLVRVKHMSALAKGISSLTFVRYSFDALVQAGEALSEVSTSAGANDRFDRQTTGVLYNLGFKPAGTALGLTEPVLAAVLVGWVLLLLCVTAVFTHRSREGN